MPNSDLISRTAAMRAFTDKPPDYYRTSYIINTLETIPAIDIEEFMRYGEWISIHERLPSYDDKVLTVISYKNIIKIGICRFMGWGWYELTTDTQYDFVKLIEVKVLYWMPLPKLPNIKNY